jgi:short-subunit dehydrogenase
MKTQIALITGASAGIGAEFARHLASQGYGLYLVARRSERLEALAHELRDAHGVRCEILAADLTDPHAPSRIVEHAMSIGLPIDILVNNAGLSGKSAFAETSWASLSGEIQVMVTAPTELCHRVIPGMHERGWGRIINLSSTAAFAPPGASLLYTGIKSYVLAISQSLDMELKPQGIHVTALCPGFTRSEFHDAMGTRGQADKLPGFLWQDASEVVREGWSAVMAGKPICVPGAVNKLMTSAMRPIPLGLQYQLGKRLNPFKQH